MTTKISIPPDPEEMNDARAEWATRGLAAFSGDTGQSLRDEGYEEVIADFICDLGHLCDREDIDLQTCFSRAKRHYAEETEFKGTQLRNPYALVTISGGVSELALVRPSSGADVDILDYDNLRESIRHDKKLSVSDEEMDFIREHDSDEFIADVERLRDEW